MIKKQLSISLLIFLSITQLFVVQPTWAQSPVGQQTRIATLKKNVAQKVRAFRDKAKKAVKEHPLLIAYGGMLLLVGIELIARNRQRLRAFIRPGTDQGVGAQQPVDPAVAPEVPGPVQPPREDAWALIVAAREGRREVVDRLLQQGIDVNARGHYGSTSLMLAAENGHREVVNSLLGAPGIDVNLQDYLLGRTALIQAVMDYSPQQRGIVDRLLQVPGIDVNLQNSVGETALMRAAMRGEREIVDQLLQVPFIDMNVRDSNGGCTALMRAAMAGHREVVGRLLQQGIDVNMRNDNGDTALMCAARHDRREVVELLLQAPNVEVNVQNNNGFPASGLARLSGDIELANRLRQLETQGNAIGQ